MTRPKPPKKVPDRVKKAIGGDLVDAGANEVAAHFFRLAGGPAAVARMLYEEFRDAKPGSLMRQRILETIMRVIKGQNTDSRSGDLALLTDEDLEREALEILEKTDGEAGTTQAGTADEPVGPAAAGHPAAAGTAGGPAPGPELPEPAAPAGDVPTP